MTHRERILAAIRGEIPDQLPWFPRLDSGIVLDYARPRWPPELASLTLTQMADRLGVGCYDSTRIGHIVSDIDMLTELSPLQPPTCLPVLWKR